VRRAALAAALALASAPALTQPAAGQSAASCSGCHAPAPRAGAAIPAIEGRPAAEIVAAMLAFKAGSRPATVMDRIAKGYSEAEIRALAATLSAPK